MRLSIIIPTLNEEGFVGSLLADLGAQNYKDFEIIHVDGRSEDKTLQIVGSYEPKLSITSISSDRRNLSHQRNLGAKNACGEYLVFIDADCRISDKSFLAKIVREIKLTRHLIYLTRIKFMKDDPTFSILWSLYNVGIEMTLRMPAPMPSPGLAIMERGFFLHIDGYKVTDKHDKNKLFGEDQDILIRAKKMGVTACAISNAYYYFSLRRFEREGWLKIFPKMFMSFIEQSTGKTFVDTDYEMGGHLYKGMKKVN